jgi:uncharacterized protein
MQGGMTLAVCGRVPKRREGMSETLTKKEKFGDLEIETLYRKSRRPVSPDEPDTTDLSVWGCSPEVNTNTHIAEDGILCEQDVPVALRDGTVIYSDIYRPVGMANIPAIVSWSYFGKRQGYNMTEWQLMGVPPGTVSRMAKFESADPGYWCQQGYACVNVDPRGVGRSQGDINMFGTQDGHDGYDFIEWLATQYWCNGKIGMFGNSGVAMTQWRIAAEQPPHLVCIAPWEGTGDIYRESIMEGGMPGAFSDFIIGSLVGSGYIDDMAAMSRRYPFMNEYWEDKIPKWEKIRIPTSITACWSHFHLRGSLEGFRRIRSTKRWLRVHREFEWPDTYSPAALEDLKRFLDRYLKDSRNGWELTPRVRIEVMDAYEYDYQVNRPEKEFPLARTQYKNLYIDAVRGGLSFEPISEESSVSYSGEHGLVTFDITFDEDTEITGFMKLHLWVEAEGNDDMDLFVNIQKLDEESNWLPTNVLDEPHPGAWGKLRVSRRALDAKLSTDFQPVQAHRTEEKLNPGEIVPVDIEIMATSRIWHKGQKLRIQLSGHYIREGWFEPLGWATSNKGNHIIHSGGKYDSFLQIPVIPTKYRTGSYVYR